MTKPTGSTRQLSFPLVNPIDIESETPNVPEIEAVTVGGFPLDSEERVNIVLNLSLDEYIALANCIDVGRDIAYGDNSIYLWWVWVRAIVSMSLCDAVADCIENDANVQNALENYLSDNGYGNGGTGGATIDPDSSALNLFPDTASCTDDNIFGMCMEIVEVIHQATLEIYEQINAIDNYGELFSQLLDNIPMIEVFGLLTEYIGWVKDSSYDNYIAAWSATIQQEIACELFCIAKEACLLTMDDIWGVYRTLSDVDEPVGGTFENWANEIIEFVAGSDLQTVTSVQMMGIAAMRYGGKFVYWSAGIRDFKTAFELAANASDPDWSILCDCPTAWCYEYDFSTGAHNWRGALNSDTELSGGRPTAATEPAGIIDTGGFNQTDYQQVNSSQVRASQPLYKDWATPVNATKITMVFNYNKGSIASGNSAQRFGYYDDVGSDAVLENVLSQDTVDGDDQTLVWTGSQQIYGLYAYIRTDVQINRIGSGLIKKIIIEGDSVETPPDATPCP